MAGIAYLVDSNILIRWVKPDDRHYALVSSTIEELVQQGCRLCYTSQNLAKFWNACTRPVERNGFGLSIAEADSRATAIENGLDFLPDSAATHQEWWRLVVEAKVSGVQVH